MKARLAAWQAEAPIACTTPFGPAVISKALGGDLLTEVAGANSSPNRRQTSTTKIPQRTPADNRIKLRKSNPHRQQQFFIFVGTTSKKNQYNHASNRAGLAFSKKNILDDHI